MYYFVANISIEDPIEYQKYIARVDEVFSKYNGKYLAVDDNTKVIEGNWNYKRSVIISFQSEEEFYKWYNSKDYQEILKHRLNAAKCDSILIKGKNIPNG